MDITVVDDDTLKVTYLPGTADRGRAVEACANALGVAASAIQGDQGRGVNTLKVTARPGREDEVREAIRRYKEQEVHVFLDGATEQPIATMTRGEFVTGVPAVGQTLTIRDASTVQQYTVVQRQDHTAATSGKRVTLVVKTS